MTALFAVPVSAAYHLVSALTGLLALLPAGLAAAAAVVVFTMAVRLLLLPLSYYAFRGQRARARLAPQVRELYRQHGKHPERLQRELAALTAAEGTGMYAGCLPALLQLPFFSVVYRLFLSATIGGSPNLLLQHRLLTVPLGSHWLSAVPWGPHGFVFALLFLLLALVGWASARAARRWTATGLPGARSAPDGTSRVMSGLARVAPFVVLIFAALVPLAAGLYLLTTTTWTLAERSVLMRTRGSGGPPIRLIPRWKAGSSCSRAGT